MATDSDNKLVTFDKTPPANQTTAQGVGAITMGSSNSTATSTLAKLGDVITLSLTSTEQIKTGIESTVVTINGNNATVARARRQSKFSLATYTMSSTDGSIM